MCQDDTKWESSTGLWSPRCLQLRDFTNQLRAMRIKCVSTLFQRDTITMLTARLFSVIFSLWCDNLPQSPSPSHALERTWKNVPGFSNRGMFVQLWSDYGWIGKVMSKRCWLCWFGMFHQSNLWRILLVHESLLNLTWKILCWSNRNVTGNCLPCVKGCEVTLGRVTWVI